MDVALECVKQQVSPRQFQMFDLYVLQNRSVQETARTLQASVVSVYVAKHRVARSVKPRSETGAQSALRRSHHSRLDVTGCHLKSWAA